MTKNWPEHRERIIRLYIQEGRTLKEVRKIMSREFNFRASIRSYNQQFDKWGVAKYHCKRRQERRHSTGSQASDSGTPLMVSPVHSPHHAQLPSQSALASPSLPGEPVRLGLPNQIIKHELQSPLMIDGVPLSHQTSQPMHSYVNHRTDLEPPGRHTEGPGGDCWLHGGPHQEKWTSRQPSFVPQGLMMNTYPRRSPPPAQEYQASSDASRLSPPSFGPRPGVEGNANWRMSQPRTLPYYHHSVAEPYRNDDMAGVDRKSQYRC